MAIEAVEHFQRGTAIYIEMECYDDVADPPVLTDPAEGPKLTLYDSLGVKALDAAQMNKKSTGVYWYVYQSNLTDERGVWEHQFTGTADDGAVGLSKPEPIWELV